MFGKFPIVVVTILLCCSCSGCAALWTPETETQRESRNLQIGRVHPFIESLPEPHPLLLEYLTAERDDFEQRHAPQALWDAGFCLQAKQPGYHDGPLYGWFDVVRVNGNCRIPVVGNMRIGDAETAFAASLGQPHFDNRGEDDGFLLTGYRFADCYMILLSEEGIVNEISFVKIAAPADAEANDILNDYNRVKTLRDLVAENDTPPLFADLNSAFGYQVFYGNGIHILDSLWENVVEIFNNYEGDIYCTNADIEYELVDEDSVFFLQRHYYKDRRERIADAHDLSPNGKMQILDGLSTRPVNGSSFCIYRADKSGPDIIVYTEHEPFGFAWLSDRYLLFNVYLHGARIFDTRTATDLPLDERIGKPIAEWDEDSFSRESACFVAVGPDAERYTVAYSFDADGALLLSEIVDAAGIADSPAPTRPPDTERGDNIENIYGKIAEDGNYVYFMGYGSGRSNSVYRVKNEAGAAPELIYEEPDRTVYYMAASGGWLYLVVLVYDDLPGSSETILLRMDAGADALEWEHFADPPSYAYFLCVNDRFLYLRGASEIIRLDHAGNDISVSAGAILRSEGDSLSVIHNGYVYYTKFSHQKEDEELWYYKGLYRKDFLDAVRQPERAREEQVHPSYFSIDHPGDGGFVTHLFKNGYSNARRYICVGSRRPF